MRTNSLQRFDGGRRMRRYVLGSIFLIAFGFLIFSRNTGSLFSPITTPLYKVRVWFLHTELSFPTYFRNRYALDTELQNLKEEVAILKINGDRVHALEEENTLLRGLSSDGGRIVADVVMRPNDTPYDTVVIDKGESEGIIAGALVYTGTTVIGVTSRTFPHSTLVTLFSSPGIMSPVYIYGPNIFAHAEGMGGGVMRISVPQGIDLGEGQPIVVPMRGSGIYGHIEHIESDVSRPEQYAFVTTEPALSSLRFLAVDPFPMPTLSFEEARAVVDKVAEDPLLAPYRTLAQELRVASSTASSTTP